jgi:hypothetical protein
MLRISLGVPYIKSICIKGKEYINTDYNPCFEIKLGVPYIKSVKIKGKEYKNTSYNNMDTYCNNDNSINNRKDRDGNNDEFKW